MKIAKLSCLILSLCFSNLATADLFLVKTADGPGFSSPEDEAAVLENGIIPTFDMLIDLQKKKKIVAAGLPIGSRTLVLIIDADSPNEVDQMLRDIPAWGVFSWKVIPLQTLQGRSDMERTILKGLKSKK